MPVRAAENGFSGCSLKISSALNPCSVSSSNASAPPKTTASQSPQEMRREASIRALFPLVQALETPIATDFSPKRSRIKFAGFAWELRSKQKFLNLSFAFFEILAKFLPFGVEILLHGAEFSPS